TATPRSTVPFGAKIPFVQILGEQALDDVAHDRRDAPGPGLDPWGGSQARERLQQSEDTLLEADDLASLALVLCLRARLEGQARNPSACLDYLARARQRLDAIDEPDAELMAAFRRGQSATGVMRGS
ncbi:MAG: hypothetical protein AAF602_05535, partial [Myxococcota bacterium]